MTLLRKFTQKASILGLAACAGMGLFQGSVQAQGFSPVDPDPILSGSVGFTDLFVFASAARVDDDNFPQKSEGDLNLRTVTSDINTAPKFGVLQTSNGSSVSTLDFETDGVGEGVFTPLTIDALGRIDGIATLTTDQGESREIPIAGRALFREYVARRYGAGEVKGFGPNTFNPYGTRLLNRNINHQLFFSGQSLGFAAVVSLNSRAFLSSSSGNVLTSYDPIPTSMNGVLVTVDGAGRQPGISIVNVTGLFDERGTFDVNGNSLFANTGLNFWQGDAPLSTPFNDSTVQGGTSVFQFAPYNTAANFPGRYRIQQVSAATLNVPLTPVNAVGSNGFFLNTAAELASVATGDGALSDLQYRDSFFFYSSPSAITVIQSLYDNSSSTLFRNDLANVFDNE